MTTANSMNLNDIKLIGMVHLPPLPGSARSTLSMAEITERAVSEARQLCDAGFDALIVENFGDAPFHATTAPSATVAALAIIANAIRCSIDKPLGINLLRNDACGALALAAVTGAAFVRVNVLSGVYATDQGLIEGDAATVLAERSRLCPQVQIAADVHVKHARPLHQLDIAVCAEETAYRAGANVLIVSGSATGKSADIKEIEAVKHAVADRPVWVGSGVTAENVGAMLKAADGVIVGTALKHDAKTTNPIDSKRLAAFINAAGR